MKTRYQLQNLNGKEGGLMKRLGNPLKKRVIRELFGEWQKYLVIALFLIIMIGFISGMFVDRKSNRKEPRHFTL